MREGARSVVVVGGVRTPFVKAGTDLREVSPWQLGCAATRELLARTGVAPESIDEVIFGCVAQPADSTNIARVIALRAGIPQETGAVTVGRNCGSGMEAVTQAVDRIASGQAEVVLAGGVESMSRIPLQYPLSFSWKLSSFMRARGLGEKLASLMAFRLRDLKPVIALEEGLTDPVCGEIMGLTAERLARDFAISREEQDTFALESHRRAVLAREFLDHEIAPFAVPPRLDERVCDDIGPRENQSMKALSKLRPYFDRKLGSVTVGNSCQVTDGGVALVLMDEARARAEGLTPLARVAGYAFRGCDPRRMGLGPVYAAAPALKEAGIRFKDLERIEINEAFAAQVIACVRAMGSDSFARQAGWSRALGEVDPAKLNVNGGAIALGHPVGATGARLVMTLSRQLSAAGGGFGLASLCIGGGQGGAIVLEGMAA